MTGRYINRSERGSWKHNSSQSTNIVTLLCTSYRFIMITAVYKAWKSFHYFYPKLFNNPALLTWWGMWLLWGNAMENTYCSAVKNNGCPFIWWTHMYCWWLEYFTYVLLLRTLLLPFSFSDIAMDELNQTRMLVAPVSICKMPLPPRSTIDRWILVKPRFRDNKQEAYLFGQAVCISKLQQVD